MTDRQPIKPPKPPKRRLRDLKCHDPYCACPGAHTCASDCKNADSCTCWSCCLCGTMTPDADCTVTAAGNPCGDCCSWRLDEEGNVVYKADGTPK